MATAYTQTHARSILKHVFAKTEIRYKLSRNMPYPFQLYLWFPILFSLTPNHKEEAQPDKSRLLGNEIRQSGRCRARSSADLFNSFAARADELC